MPASAHPHWGRPIESYASIPNVARTALSVDAELAGLQAMQKLSQLSTEGVARNQTAMGSKIDISMLEDALRLSADPLTIGHLANPSAISGCIRLMTGVVAGKSGKASPFSYEYGHICFMLLVSCLNVCLLERWDHLNDARGLCTQHDDNTPQIIISNIVASGVLGEFQALNDGGDCDRVLGWSTSAAHRRHSPLLSQSDILALLGVLWDDRKLFVRAQAMTRSTPGGFGLSGLMFVFSRYLSQKHASFPTPGRDVFAARLYELVLRYNVVASRFQRQATLCIMDANPCGSQWTSTPKHIDAEDSRFILTNFIKQLADPDDPDILTKRDPSMMLRFVPLTIDTDTQDPLPEVLRWTIQHGWSVLFDMGDEVEIETFLSMNYAAMSWIISPPHGCPCNLTSSTQNRIIKVIHDGDLLDWTARAMLRLNPVQSHFGEVSLKSITCFFAVLAKTVPSTELGCQFQSYPPDWQKFNVHLFVVGHGIPTVSSPKYQQHYASCMGIWQDIARFLGIEHAVHNYTGRNCSSPRCPRAYMAEEALLGCVGCGNTIVYCDARCQIIVEMSHPPFWLSKQFFYPIGNTGAVSLTQDLSPEQSSADILLLGCGDPRNILFTLYSDLTVSQGSRKIDITCCDIEPAILARNILLFSLLDQNENIDRVWDIFYHFKIDDRTSKIISRQSQALHEYSEDIESWQGSRYGPFIKMVDTRTLTELHRHWKSYADFTHLPSHRKNRIVKEQVKLSKSVEEKGNSALSASRSAGMLWPQAMTPVADLFRKYWETGTTFTLASDLKSATHLNPTFAYSLSGEGFNPHYGTFPAGFHLMSAFAPIKTDPAGPVPSTGSVVINASKQQFTAWCKAFCEARKNKSITIRFFAGDALLFCRALHQFETSGNSSTDIFVSAYRAAQIRFDTNDASDACDVAPKTFDVIDTSNLTDHLGLFNLLLATHVLLKGESQSQAVLYTETLLPSGKDVTKSFLERMLTDVPTITALFGIAPRPLVSNFTTNSNVHEIIFAEGLGQYHERVAWCDPSGGDRMGSDQKTNTVSFEAGSLARVLYEIYDNMFSNEKVSTIMSSLSITPTVRGMRALGEVHYHRETVGLLFKAVQRRVHLRSGNWEQVVMSFLQMCISGGGRMIESNCYQDLCLQLHLYGVFTVDTLKVDWDTDPENRFSPRSNLFDKWPSLPPVVCVVLTVPRQRLAFLSSNPDQIGSPTLQGGLWVSGAHDNTYGAIYLAWGRCVASAGSDQVTIEEDLRGQQGQSDLVVSFWASTRLVEIAGTNVSLRIKSTPMLSPVLVRKLGMTLDIFGASVMDKKHVRVLTYRPTLASDLSQIAPSEASPTTYFEPHRFCDAIVSNPMGRRVDSLSIRFGVKDKEEQDRLQNGAQVSASQVSACTMELKIGAHSHLITYPYPIHGQNNKLRIARKSLYVEVVVPVSTPNDYSGYFLNPFPVINPGAYTTWNVHHVRLDRLPTLDVKDPTKVDWLNALTALQLSQREKAIRNGNEVQKHLAINALVNVKDSIHAITMNVSGLQGRRTRTTGLCEKSQGGVYVLLLVGGLKLDSASSTIVLDTAIVPLSNERMPALMPGIQKIQNTGTLVQISTVGHEVGAWKRLIPAFVERCRNWNHLSKCEYRLKGQVPLSTVYDENPICTCGQGIGFTTSDWKAPEWKDLLPFATRAAISPIFSVSYIERVVGDWSEHREATTSKAPSKPTGACWACGGPGKPALSTCSRCKIARYCSVTCQRQDWKAHKGTCTPGDS